MLKMDVDNFTVVQLRGELKKRGLSTQGLKQQLVERLRNADSNEFPSDAYADLMTILNITCRVEITESLNISIDISPSKKQKRKEAPSKISRQSLSADSFLLEEVNELRAKLSASKKSEER